MAVSHVPVCGDAGASGSGTANEENPAAPGTPSHMQDGDQHGDLSNTNEDQFGASGSGTANEDQPVPHGTLSHIEIGDEESAMSLQMEDLFREEEMEE